MTEIIEESDVNTISELESVIFSSGRPSEALIVSLLNGGAKPPQYLLHYTYIVGLRNIFQLLLEWGLEPDTQTIYEIIKRGDFELLKTLKIDVTSQMVELAKGEIAEFLKKVQPAFEPVKSRIERPKLPTEILLYSSVGLYGGLTNTWEQARLFQLDGYHWDSVERYMMYKMYEGTVKGAEILNAGTLQEAKDKFNIFVVPTARTPKQLVINQKLAPLAQSQAHPDFADRCESLYIRATHAKIKQNRWIYQLLQSTDGATIINKNVFDQFGYVGNLLGNILMTIRDGSSKNIVKTNNMSIEKYSGNTNFHVIRGDADNQLKNELKEVCSFKTAGDRLIPAKYYTNLKGGGGWLVPNANAASAKQILFKTWPDYKKIVLFGQKWLKKQIDRYLRVATLVAVYREHPDVTVEDMAFTIQDVYGSGAELLESTTPPRDEFIQIVWKLAKNSKIVVAEKAVEMLWNLLANLIDEITKSVQSFKDFKAMTENIEGLILDIPITPIQNLTERESIIIVAFVRLYRLIKRLHPKNESKLCMLVIQILVGHMHYEQIKAKYNKKIRNMVKATYSNDEEEFRKRFLIKNHNITTILKHLPVDQSKKCKLFLLTTIDYILDLEGEEGIETAKNLILVSQRGKQPSPTPAAAETFNDELDDIIKEHDGGKKSSGKSNKKGSEKSSGTSSKRGSEKSSGTSSKRGSEKSSKRGSEKSSKRGSEKSSKRGSEKSSTSSNESDKED